MSNVEENEGKSKTEYQPVKGSKEEEQAKTETKPTGAVPLELTLSQAQQPFQYHVNSTPLVVSLRNVESHLETDTDNREIWLSELSSKVNEFVDTEYRTLPTFACDTGGTSPLGKTFDRVKGLLENRIILLEEEIVLLDAKIDSLSKVIDSVQNSMVEQLRNNTQLKDKIRDQKDTIRDEKDEIAKELKIIGDQKDKISQHHAILTNGTFFSSLDDVWTAGEKYTNIPTVDGRVFKREIHVLSNEMEDSNSFEDIFGCYEKTAIGALNSENEVIENSSRTSQRSESISAEAEAEAEVDIFGGKIEGSESAHLMPHSSSCAALWYTVVESVLSLSQEPFTKSNWWKVLQKCIHGYGKSKKGADKRDKSGDSTESKSDKDEQDKNSASIKVRKTANVGIKHFATNRIRLHYQALHLDKNPCLLIIPVMDNKQVKEWDGGGYYAIVLAGPILKKSLKKSSTIDSKKTIAKEGKVGETDTNPAKANPAKFIYQNIRAYDGGVEGEFLATNEDLEKSRILLETAVLCIAKSCKASYGADCPPETKQWHEDVKKGLCDAINNADKRKGGKIKEAYEKLLSFNSVKVPANKNHSDTFDSKYVKVRKILFSSRVAGQSAHLHLAPDPMLLLAKAASNWLKRQDLLLLPGCEVVSDDSSSVGYDEECKARRLHNRHPDKKHRITEITIQCRSSSTDDESISDLDC